MRKDTNKSRREFLKKSTLAASALLNAPEISLNNFSKSTEDPEFLIPENKKLSKKWIKSLTLRGKPDLFKSSKNELKYIGMPIGGIACGQLYLGGDGRLWLWHIFKTQYKRNPDSQLLNRMEQGGHYAYPDRAFLREKRPLAQGVAIQVKQKNKLTTKKLNSEGFNDITFRGEYPIGRVNYRDKKLPVKIDLEAFSPFIPGELKKSANPATIMSYTICNTSSEDAEVTLAGWLENAVCPFETKEELGIRKASFKKEKFRNTLYYTAEGKEELSKEEGYGSLSWTLYKPSANSLVVNNIDGNNIDRLFSGLRSGKNGESWSSGINEFQLAGLGERFVLKPGEEKEVTFILGWYFPYLNRQPQHHFDVMGITDIEKLKLHYANNFTSADDVARQMCENYEELAGNTRLWNKTWYNSTLPYWLLDRAFIPINCMASNTLLWFDNNRIWGWEGVECCPGTCQHVWQYAQAMAHIFPEAEKNLREKTDLNPAIGFMEQTGGFAYRAENKKQVAHDGHCGTIMRIYREHKLSEDDSFLRRHYSKVKKAVQFLINEDKDKDGLLEGKQQNTLDAAWYGPMGWISSLYLGALAAGKAMACEMGDESFANKCNLLLELGRTKIVDELFNGEYFIHKPDENYPKAINSNDGCHIDQVLGQSFALQVGLNERVVPKEQTVKALESIWKYNFAPDAFSYQKRHKAIKGPRIYATSGEPGTLMCTWPNGGDYKAVPGMESREDNPDYWSGPGIYFDECMNGFEYQVASHMVWEGLVEKGLALTKVIHERYNAQKRNPFNEIECSDHYSRSMASYGVFLGVCGFDYHGPKGKISFAPKIGEKDFKAPFTVATGWGTFSQSQSSGVFDVNLELIYGTLYLNNVSVNIGSTKNVKYVRVQLDGKDFSVSFKQNGEVIRIAFPGIKMKKNQKLNFKI